VTERGSVDERSPVLTMSGITVRFGGAAALDDVDLRVRPRQVLGVIGPNGAGKTTLLDVASGFVKPASGHLTWHGTRLPDLRPKQLAKLPVSRTLQAARLVDANSVLENVMAGPDPRVRTGLLSGGLARPRNATEERSKKEAAQAALGDLGITEHADEHPPGLPPAVRTRVAIARALVGQPELLLLDEPAGGLTREERHGLGAVVRRLARRMSVVMVEHHMDLVMQVCDEIVVLDGGRVIAQGTPEDVGKDPAVLAAYLG
jgi:branched-chain amino acid transport system ATP-binding protein